MGNQLPFCLAQISTLSPITGTYNQGVILGGLVDLWVLTKSDNNTNSTTYLTKAVTLASSSMENLKDGQGVFVEPRAGYSSESQRNFKGAYVQHLSYLTNRILANKAEAAAAGVDVPSFVSEVKAFLTRNYQAVVSMNKGALDSCSGGVVWQGEGESIPAGYMSTNSVINLFMAYDTLVTAS